MMRQIDLMVAAAVAAAAVLTAGVAHADSQDDKFWAAVQADATIAAAFHSEDEAIREAHLVCGFFNKGYPYRNILLANEQALHLSEEKAALFIGDALGVYCPNHLEDLIGQ